MERVDVGESGLLDEIVLIKGKLKREEERRRDVVLNFQMFFEKR